MNLISNLWNRFSDDFGRTMLFIGIFGSVYEFLNTNNGINYYIVPFSLILLSFTQMKGK